MRICSFAQESTRYCNYSADRFGNEITVIEPYWKGETAYLDSTWENAMEFAEKTYFDMLERGLKPQDARGVLPNDLKTEINVKANLREWRQIFKLRTSSAAHPDMRRLMIPLCQELSEKIPIIFEDICKNGGR